MKDSARTVSPSREITFVAAMWLLGIFAVIQIAAGLWKVVPPAVEDGAFQAPVRSEEERVAEVDPDPMRAAPVQTPDPARTQEAMALISQSTGFQSIGEWDDALASLDQAIALLPENPQLMLQRAFILGRMERLTEAIDQLDVLLEIPDLDEDLRFDALRLTDLLMQTRENIATVAPGSASAAPAASSAANATANAAADGSEVAPIAPLLEEVGLQPGATLGIVDIREVGDEGGFKTLRIAIKNRPGELVAPSDVKVHVQFFEKDASGGVVLTESAVRSEWFTPPIDWDEDEPELLDVVYPIPGLDPEADESEVLRTYHGYVIGLYYQDELQDSRSVPGQLEREFPLDLFLNNAGS